MTLTVGQQLYYVPSQRRAEPGFVTVTKVGRKWAEIGPNRRVNMETMALDGGGYSSPGTCYLSKEEHDAEVELRDTWARFRELMDGCYGVPDGIRPSQIENAARALFGRSVLKHPPTAAGEQK